MCSMQVRNRCARKAELSVSEPDSLFPLRSSTSEPCRQAEAAGVWRGMEGCGGVWRGVEGYGGVWRGMEGYGGVWRGMEGYGGVWDGGGWQMCAGGRR
jgi:hypothetical protein